MADDASTLLSAADLAELGELMFVARRAVEGLYAGRHRSPRRGHSTEFHDYRPYLPGDEPRRVDWKLFGRTDRLYLKRFRHESDLNVLLLVDRSASMDFAGLASSAQTMQPPAGRRRASRPAENLSKWTCARQLAAAIAFLLTRQRDRVGLMFFDDDCEVAVPMGAGPEHLHKVIAALAGARLRRYTDPVRALARAHAALSDRHRRRGMVVVISDMLESVDRWASAFAPFAHDRFDLIALQVLHPQELDLRGIGIKRLVDRESWQSMRLNGRQIGPAYTRQMQRHITQLRRGLARLAVDHQLLLTSTPPIRALGRFVARRTEQSPGSVR